MEIRPLSTKILVVLEKLEGKTKGGIILVNEEKKVEWGTVKGVYAGCESVKVGDRVAFFTYDRDPIEDDVCVVDEDKLVAVRA